MKSNCYAVVLTLLGIGTVVEAGEVITAPGEPIPNRYIAVLQDSVDANLAGPELAQRYGGSVERTWTAVINGVLLSGVTSKSAHELADDSRVLYVQEDSYASIAPTQLNPTWGLDRIDQRVLPLDRGFFYSYDGSGVHAYVLDTGIRNTHEEFDGGARATRDLDVVGDGMNGADCFGHGTQVAGVLAGTTYGVAKRARVHSLRVCDCNGLCAISGIVTALDWIVVNGQRPGVVNMSLGVAVQYPGVPALDAAVDGTIGSGFVVVASAGNSGADACNTSPARVPAAITVGATGPDDIQAGFSNYGGCLDLFAPGREIVSASHLSDSEPSPGLQGTSYAAPHVAGAAALVLHENPAYAPSEVATRIVNDATTGAIQAIGQGSPNRLLYIPPIVPSAPKFLDVRKLPCYGENEAEWTETVGAASYELYGASTPSFASQTLIYRGPATWAYFSVNKTTYLRVRACSPLGCGGYRVGNKPATYVAKCSRD